LSVTPHQQGQETVALEHPNGGTFEAVLPVRPRFTFTQVGNPANVRVFDTGMLGIPPSMVRWGEVIPPAGDTREYWCTDEMLDMCPGDNFSPGVLCMGGAPCATTVEVRPNPGPGVDLSFSWTPSTDPRDECITYDILAGDDCWATSEGSEASFEDNPIPADFFAPGSLPFEGTVYFSGVGDGLPDTVRSSR
jgi:hypothetical protein